MLLYRSLRLSSIWIGHAGDHVHSPQPRFTTAYLSGSCSRCLGHEAALVVLVIALPMFLQISRSILMLFPANEMPPSPITSTLNFSLDAAPASSDLSGIPRCDKISNISSQFAFRFCCILLLLPARHTQFFRRGHRGCYCRRYHRRGHRFRVRLTSAYPVTPIFNCASFDLPQCSSEPL